MLKLIPPGRRGACWYIRGTYRGHRYEYSTGQTHEDDADAFRRTFIERIDLLHLTEEAEVPVVLVPPRGAVKEWHLRCRVGEREIDLDTRSSTERDARAFLQDYLAGGVAHEIARRSTPEVVPLGEFERWLSATFALLGETVVWRADRSTLTFHLVGAGYLGATVNFGPLKKRVLAHRLKFLLAHGWLPRSIDHDDGRRWNNQLLNLKAATPATQQANIRLRRTGGKVRELQKTE